MRVRQSVLKNDLHFESVKALSNFSLSNYSSLCVRLCLYIYGHITFKILGQGPFIFIHCLFLHSELLFMTILFINTIFTFAIITIPIIKYIIYQFSILLLLSDFTLLATYVLTLY